MALGKCPGQIWCSLGAQQPLLSTLLPTRVTNMSFCKRTMRSSVVDVLPNGNSICSLTSMYVHCLFPSTKHLIGWKIVETKAFLLNWRGIPNTPF